MDQVVAIWIFFIRRHCDAVVAASVARRKIRFAFYFARDLVLNSNASRKVVALDAVAIFVALVFDADIGRMVENAKTGHSRFVVESCLAWISRSDSNELGLTAREKSGPNVEARGKRSRDCREDHDPAAAQLQTFYYNSTSQTA